MISLLLHVALAASPPPQIPFEKYTLSNGLQVILAPDDSVPFVWVNLWYYVGSKDEVVGRTGFAHLYEHMMFQGSAHMDDDYFQPLQRVGGQVNGTTNLDRTNFFEGVPSEYLPMALFLESDRMGWLLPAMTQEKL
ncbi:MAG TPA: insulinase family protein, partial [Myxococcota bacterium]|nr:insulinase family protein [Myxococcota bacterium]